MPIDLVVCPRSLAGVPRHYLATCVMLQEPTGPGPDIMRICKFCVRTLWRIFNYSLVHFLAKPTLMGVVPLTRCVYLYRYTHGGSANDQVCLSIPIHKWQRVYSFSHVGFLYFLEFLPCGFLILPRVSPMWVSYTEVLLFSIVQPVLLMIKDRCVALSMSGVCPARCCSV